MFLSDKALYAGTRYKYLSKFIYLNILCYYIIGFSSSCCLVPGYFRIITHCKKQDSQNLADSISCVFLAHTFDKNHGINR